VSAVTARFTGVSKRTAEGTFVASLRVQGKMLKLGAWLREIDAAIAFDRAALWFDRDGSLNLPSESRTLGPCSPEDLRRIALSHRKRARGSSSQFRGVTWRAGEGAWAATVRVDGVIERASGFETEEAAAIAYDRLLLGLGGDRAKLNFPDRQHDPISANELRAQLGARRKSKRTSVFRGVCAGPNNRWHAEIFAEGRRHRCGEWTEESAAAEAYDRAALFFRGPSASRNFPRRRPPPTAPADLRAESRACRKATCTSRYIGVTWHESTEGYSGWRAELRCDGVLHVIGKFEDEREAAIAYDRLARTWFGAEAKLNFPDELLPPTSLEELRREKRSQYKETTTSRFNGVSWKADTRAWVAGIRVDHVYYFLGYYGDEEEAAHAYDRKRWELRGEGPYNFPDAIPGRQRRAGP
jgi:hypothetical protein